MKVAPALISCFIGLTGMSIAPVGSVLLLKPMGDVGEVCFLGQAIDEVVHDEIDHVDVLARAVIEMVAADGETVAVAAEQEDMQVGSGQADAGSKGTARP
jgi:hypothetical protein